MIIVPFIAGRMTKSDWRDEVLTPFVLEYNDARERNLRSISSQTLRNKIGLRLLASGFTDEEMMKQAFYSALKESDETMFGSVVEQMSFALLLQRFDEVSDWKDLLQKDGVIGWGRLSPTGAICRGLDVEIRSDNKYYLVNVKSSDNWGNDAQWRAFKADTAQRASVIRQSGFNGKIIPLIGAAEGCSGIRRGTIHVLAGEDWWTFVSGESGTYERVQEVLRLGGSRFDLKARLQSLISQDSNRRNRLPQSRSKTTWTA